VFIGGPNPSLRDDQPYSQKHFDGVCELFGDPASLNRYDTVFIDSITVAARLCFQWCKGEPQAFSDKTGKPDTRGAYGLQGQEMIAWLTHLQHTRNKNVWFVGILDEKTDDFNRRLYQPQIEGSKTGLELPGIVDQVITMADVTATEGVKDSKFYRVFVCHGDDLIHNARQLKTRFASLDLRLIKTAVKIIRLLVQNTDKPNILIAGMLQMGEPGDHFLALQTISPSGIRFAGFITKRLRFAFTPLKTQPSCHGD
jgi:hypothetical protein